MSTDLQRQAGDLHAQAQAADDEDEALRLYHQALALDADRPETLYNIGLIHKYRGEWAASLDFNQRAAALCPDDEATNWNVAIAATALCDWVAARAAWQRQGIRVAGESGPIEDDFGLSPVRLNPDGAGEVVWGRRIDPVRARLVNIPYGDSGFRFGDIVLHDGAPTGTRVWQGRDYGVFNVFGLHTPSRMTTFELAVTARSADDVAALTEAVERIGGEVEDWTASVRILCKACSEGRPHEDHDEAGGRYEGWISQRRLGAAAEDEAALRAAVARWAGPGRRVTRFDAVLRPPLAD